MIMTKSKPKLVFITIKLNKTDSDEIKISSNRI